MCRGSSILHNVLASSQIADTYSSYLVVFPAVDLDDLLTIGDVTDTAGEVGQTSGSNSSSKTESGSGMSWVVGSGSTCC